jgi:hypothetical protein
VDLVFAVDIPVDAALDPWTDRLYAEFGALHHWDLPAGPIVYRVFLLPGSLEVDIAFTPAAEFGPLGPNWRTVFGRVMECPAGGPADPGNLIGLAWHHALHARVCVERRRWWQAEHWIGAVRAQVIALACLRLGHRLRQGRPPAAGGADRAARGDPGPVAGRSRAPARSGRGGDRAHGRNGPHRTGAGRPTAPGAGRTRLRSMILNGSDVGSTACRVAET